MVSYEGEKDYIFISYSHRDEGEVRRIVDRLQKDGYRVWYDEGINPGNEWPEIIAAHLRDCALFMAFISGEYLDSFNCKREIDYAVSKRKPFISVLIEEVELTPGMEMQLSGVQALLKYQMDEEQFFTKLYQSELVVSSRDESEESKDEAEDSRNESGDSRDESEAEVREDKPRTAGGLKQKEKKERSPKRLTPLRIAVIVAIVLISATGLFLVSKRVSNIEINGTEIPRNESYVSLASANLPSSELKKLSGLTELHSLKLTECDLPDGAGVLKDLSGSVSDLDIESCTGITDYSFISGLSHLTSLSVTDCGMNDKDLSSIDFSGLRELKSVNLNGNKDITDLSPLSGADGLNVLRISNTGAADIGILSGFSELRILEASATGIEDISPLASCAELEEIELNDCRISSLQPLGGMTELRVLKADGNMLEDLDGLQGKEELESLSVADNSLKDLNGMETAYRLKDLIAYGNDLESAAGLSSCTVLENVDLHDNDLSDVSVLAKSKETLIRLDLSKNRLTDLSYMEGMPGLEKIFLDENGIEDLSFLSRSPLLEVLSAEHNRIGSFEPVAQLEAIQYLYLGDNVIEGRVQLENMPAISNVYLQHNLINEISYSSEERETVLGIPIQLSLLSAYDNPLYSIKDVYGKGEDRPASRINEGYISFPVKEEAEAAGYEYDPFGLADAFHSLYLADCPYDERLKVEEINSWTEYETTEQMDRMIMDKEGEKGF